MKKGIGLSNIKSIADKYNGAMSINTQKESFCLNVLLIIPQQEEKTFHVKGIESSVLRLKIQEKEVIAMETGVIQNSTVFQKKSIGAGYGIPVRSLEDRDITDKPASLPSPHDEYIKSENSSDTASGLYKVVPDENGSYKILYDDPKAEASKSSEEGMYC